MFNYRRIFAHIFLACYILTSVFICSLALQSGSESSSLSGSIYTKILEFLFGEEKREQDVEAVALQSLEIVPIKDTYLVGDVIDLTVNATPLDHTNVLTYHSSNKSVAYFNLNNKLIFLKAGQVTVWVESDNGIKSNQVTFTCEEPKNSLDGLDLTLFSIVCPSEVFVKPIDPIAPDADRSNAYLLSYRYNEKSLQLACSFKVTNQEVAQISGSYLVTKAVGTTQIELYFEDTLLATKSVEVKEGVFENPTLLSIYLGDREVKDDEVTLTYGESYKLNVNFEDGIQRKIKLLGQTSQTPAVSASNGDDNVSVYISAIACSQMLVRVLLEDNPVISEYIAEFKITVIPPKAVVTGIEISEKVVINKKYKASLITTNEYAKQGYTYRVTDEENCYVDTSGNMTFKKSGTYEIVFTSKFYPDDVYKFYIVVEDPVEETNLRKQVGHFGLFLILGIFGLLAFGRYPKRNGSKIIWVATAGAFVALLSEFFQSGLFTAGRAPSFIDVLIDFSGYLSGAIIVLGVLFVIYLISKRRSASFDTDDE